MHIGRTNTEYLTLNPKWGMNEKSAGRSRLHVPGKSTIIEKWEDHDTAFVTYLKAEQIFSDQELVFEVYDENPITYGHTTHDFMGEVKISIEDLLPNEEHNLTNSTETQKSTPAGTNSRRNLTRKNSLENVVIDDWFELSPLHSTKRVWSRHLEKEQRKRGSIGTIHLRLELILPEEEDLVDKDGEKGASSMKDTQSANASSDSQSQLGGTNNAISNYNLIAQYRKLRDAAFSIQNKMGHLADRYERMKNVLLWVSIPFA